MDNRLQEKKKPQNTTPCFSASLLIPQTAITEPLKFMVTRNERFCVITFLNSCPRLILNLLRKLHPFHMCILKCFKSLFFPLWIKSEKLDAVVCSNCLARNHCPDWVVSYLVVVGLPVCLHFIVNSDCSPCGAFMPSIFSIAWWRRPDWGDMPPCAD